MRPRGGIIGATVQPAASAVNSAASGVWTLREAEALKRAGTWPTYLESPTQIAGLQLWLDAADGSTLFDATAGGSLVAVDGTVKRWQDKSGNQRHCTEFGSGPQRKAAQINGRGVVRFNGTNTQLSGTSTPGGGNARTTFVVAKANTSSGGELLQLGANLLGGAGFLHRAGHFSGNTLIGGDLYTNNLIISGTELPVTSAFVGCIVQASRSSFQYFHNAASYSVTGTLNSFSMNEGYFVGALRGSSSFGFYDGDIGEIIVYDAALSSSNRVAVEAYLISKWGIT